MSRIRTIKPDFWVSEQIINCSRDARLFFIGMWNFFDDDGVHPISVFKLKNLIFPADNFTIDQINMLINELISNELVKEIELNGKKFWKIINWKKHQKINRPTTKYLRHISSTCNYNSMNCHDEISEESLSQGGQYSSKNNYGDHSTDDRESDIFVRIPVKNGYYDVTKEDMKNWKSIYKNVDVEKAIISLCEFYTNNPNKILTKVGVLRRFTRWLSDAHQSNKFSQENNNEKQNIKKSPFMLKVV